MADPEMQFETAFGLLCHKPVTNHVRGGGLYLFTVCFQLVFFFFLNKRL